MATAQDVITGAMKLLGVVFKGEAPSADEAEDGLAALNEMIDSWGNDNTLTFSYDWETFPLTSSASYTIGTGQDFDTSRPINIAASYIRSGNVDYALEIITPEQYNNEISVKTITSSIPRYLSYDNGYPYGTIRLYPVPNGVASIFLLMNKPLSTFAALSDTVSLPPGWLRALKYNLAVELAPQYGVEVTNAVIKGAKDSIGAIRRATSVNNGMPPMPSLPQQPYILSGWI